MSRGNKNITGTLHFVILALLWSWFLTAFFQHISASWQELDDYTIIERVYPEFGSKALLCPPCRNWMICHDLPDFFAPMWSETAWLVRPRRKARSQLEQNVLPSLLYLAWLRALKTDKFLFVSWSPLLGLVFQFFEVVWSLAWDGWFHFHTVHVDQYNVDLVWSYDIFLGKSMNITVKICRTSTTWMAVSFPTTAHMQGKTAGSDGATCAEGPVSAGSGRFRSQLDPSGTWIQLKCSGRPWRFLTQICYPMTHPWCLQDWEEFLQAKFRFLFCVIPCWIIEIW